MDLGFGRGGRLGPAARVAHDQRRLVAALSAAQTASATARALRDAEAGRLAFASDRAALVALFAGDPRWRTAAAALGQSFRAGLRARQTSCKPS